MKRNETGWTLIETTIFIVVIGIAMTGLLVGMNQVLINSSTPERIAQASFLANARMEVIRLQKSLVGLSSVSDPCLSGSPPAICTPLLAFASANGLTVASSFTPMGGNVVVNVTVSGRGSAQVETLMSNY